MQRLSNSGFQSPMVVQECFEEVALYKPSEEQEVILDCLHEENYSSILLLYCYKNRISDLRLASVLERGWRGLTGLKLNEFKRECKIYGSIKGCASEGNTVAGGTTSLSVSPSKTPSYQSPCSDWSAPLSGIYEEVRQAILH